MEQNFPFENVTDEQILAALFGETVTIVPGVPLTEIHPVRYTYTLTFDGKNFILSWLLGVLTCDEANLRLVCLF